MKIWRTEADYHLAATVTARHAVKAIAEAQRILATTPAPDPA